MFLGSFTLRKNVEFWLSGWEHQNTMALWWQYIFHPGCLNIFFPIKHSLAQQNTMQFWSHIYTQTRINLCFFNHGTLITQHLPKPGSKSPWNSDHTNTMDIWSHNIFPNQNSLVFCSKSQWKSDHTTSSQTRIRLCTAANHHGILMKLAGWVGRRYKKMFYKHKMFNKCLWNQNS